MQDDITTINRKEKITKKCPCCNGDMVRFKFEEKGYKNTWKEKGYGHIEIGRLGYCVESKRFIIVFGPYINGHDYIDWTTDSEGPEWFEKVE